MVSLERPEQEKSKRADIGPDMRAVLRRVHVNMPWKFLPRYRELVLDNSINIEIGFGAEELDALRTDEVASVMDRIRKSGCGVTAHGPFWDLCTGSVDPEIRRVARSRLDRFFEILEHVRPKQVVCHTGFDPRHHRGHRAVWVENALSVWKPLVQRAEEMGILLLLENVWEEGPGLHLEIFGKIGSAGLGFCLDTGHQHAFSKTGLRAWLDAVWPYLGEIHLHDNDGSDDYHLPAGLGTIDFDLLFHFLEEKGISPVLTLEPHTEEHLFQSLAGLSKMESFRRFTGM